MSPILVRITRADGTQAHTNGTHTNTKTHTHTGADRLSPHIRQELRLEHVRRRHISLFRTLQVRAFRRLLLWVATT